jgi:hypothetical protein
VFLSRALAIAATGLALVAALSGVARGAPGHRACGPGQARTVLAKGEVRVYATAAGYVSACDARDGNAVPLTSVQGAATFLMPVPAVAIAGSVVAFGEDDLSDATGSQTVTFIQVKDLAGFPRILAILPAQPSPEGLGAGSKVVTTVVRPDGAVAWISCRQGTRIPESDLATGRRARCQHPGTHSWVYAQDAAGEPGQNPASNGVFVVPRLLDQGAHIAPRSLALHGATLTWRDGAQLRSATLD